MWISKKKLDKMMAEVVEKEREREMMYRFMDETHVTNCKLEERVHEVEREVEELKQAIRDLNVRKKQLNG